MRRQFAIALLVSAVSVGLSQENKPISDAGVVTCDNPSTEKNSSKWVSSDAGFSAEVELKASVVGLGDHRRCVTSCKLHVRGKDRKEKVLAIADREDSPGDNEWVQENSFEINGWSKDGQLVLASQIESQGDWDETNPVIFDFASGKFWRVNLFSLLKRLIPSGCYVVYRAIAFSADNDVLIESLSTDDDREPGTKPCFPASRWKLDFRKNTIVRVETKKKDK